MAATHNSEGYFSPTEFEAMKRIESEERKTRRLAAFRPLVYIYSPYRGNTNENIENARKYSRFAVRHHSIPFAPHLLFPQFLDDTLGEERQTAMFMNYVMLTKCVELWVFGSHVSEGMAQDVINVIFNPDDTVNLRVFDDRKDGIFTGAKLSVEAGKFFAVESTLREHNKKNHGIFFVVNSGGQTDDSITRINAQFVEMDDKTFEEQQSLIDAFPLPPSMIIRTRKSLHTYWFVKDAKVAKFRPIQKALVQYFGGDSACVNESRVMRLPGFYHCKKEPVLVECISFHPECRYTQEQLAEVLPNVETEVHKEELHGEQKDIHIVEAECDFIKYCRDNVASLPEYDWYAMISNLSVFDGGAEVIHQYSKPYPSYSYEETQKKIQHFLSSGTKPMTCRTIAEKGYQCPKLKDGKCKCKSPAALCFQPLTINGIRVISASAGNSECGCRGLADGTKFCI